MASPPAILDASGPSDHAAVRAALQDLAQQPAQLAVVDVRPRESFLQGPRLRGSCHVPGHDLAARCFLLPDHETRLGVVLPAGTDLPTQGCRTLPLFLHSHGWTQVAWCVRASPELWRLAAELGVLESEEPGDAAVPGHQASHPDERQARLLQRFAFTPCPLLLDEVRRVERLLLEQHRQAGQQGAAGPQGPPQPAALRCLEPGCGSGRNMLWLAARRVGDPVPIRQPPSTAQTQQQAEGQPHQRCKVQGDGKGQGDADEAADEADAGGVGGRAQQQSDDAPAALASAHWTVVGVDNWHSALVRAQQCCQDTWVAPDRAQFWFAQVSSGTGELEPLQAPGKKEASTCVEPAGGSPYMPLPAPAPWPRGHWHLVLCVRFLERAFLPLIPSLLCRGGFLLFNTFLDMEGTRRFGRPKGPKHLLQREELSALFGPAQGFEVLRDDVALCKEGRELSMFVARKVAG